MPRYPHTKLFIHPQHIVVLSGPHIQVLDALNGCILHSTTTLAGEDEFVFVNSGPIRCSGMSQDGRYLATTTDDKRLRIWDLESFTLLNSRELPKKPTSVGFTSSADILVADKFGDVFRYALDMNREVVKEKNSSDKLASHENLSSAELVLGHTSLLTSCLLTPDERFIITADRDEHIRVSWYPEGHVIESYCLGHKKYVSAIHVPALSPTTLISGGGDPELKIWDWMTGRLQRNISILTAVEPFIQVTPQNRRNGSPDEDCRESEKEGRRDTSLEPGDSEHQKLLEEGSNETFTATAMVLVVRKLSSFLSEGQIHVVFSVLGASAIFEFILSDTNDSTNIRHHDFGKPVVDFTVWGEGLIWVLLDADFPEVSDVSDGYSRNLVQVIQWSVTDQKFVDTGNSALADSLNMICSLPATAAELMVLDLYADLSSLPKNIDGELGGRIERTGLGLSCELPDDECGEVPSSSVTLTKRTLARLKHKRALDQLHYEKANGGDMTGPDTKKMKSGSDGGESHTMT